MSARATPAAITGGRIPAGSHFTIRTSPDSGEDRRGAARRKSRRVRACSVGLELDELSKLPSVKSRKSAQAGSTAQGAMTRCDGLSFTLIPARAGIQPGSPPSRRRADQSTTLEAAPPLTKPAPNALVIQEAAQLARPAGMLELTQRLRLDLADALAGHRELLADFFQRVVGVHADAETHAQHALFARRERSEHARRGLAQVRLDGGVDRQDRVLVLDEIAEMRILFVADRSLERQRLLGDLENLAHLFERHAELLGQFLRRRLA